LACRCGARSRRCEPGSGVRVRRADIILRQEDTIPDSADGEAPASRRTIGLLGLLIELLLPVTLGAALLIVLAGYTSYWNPRSGVGLVVFGVLLVLLSSVLSLKLDTMTRRRRLARGRPLLNRPTVRTRLFKLVVGGTVIPVAALVAANVVRLPNRETPMAMAVRLRVSASAGTREQQLGDAVLRAKRPAKVQGIRALQSAGSAEALAQLLRILREDREAVQGGSESRALESALASYGERAKPGLLDLLGRTDASTRHAAEAPPGDLFEREFSAAFEELRREIDSRAGDPASQAAERSRIDVAQAELKRALGQLEAETRSARADDGLPGLVLATFLEMPTKEDGELLTVARRIAADPAWSDPVRGQALLLVAKLGAKDDLDGLYAQLASTSPVLQARAMQAIAALQTKLAAH
jgi:hypothetical protein